MTVVFFARRPSRSRPTRTTRSVMTSHLACPAPVFVRSSNVMPCGEYALMDTWRAWKAHLAHEHVLHARDERGRAAMTAAMPMTMPRMVRKLSALVRGQRVPGFVETGRRSSRRPPAVGARTAARRGCAHHAVGVGGHVGPVRMSTMVLLMSQALERVQHLGVPGGGRGCRGRRPGMSAGSFTRARAMATRCIWPPDSLLLRWSYSRSVERQLRSAAWGAQPSASLRGQAVDVSGSTNVAQHGGARQQAGTTGITKPRRARISASRRRGSRPRRRFEQVAPGRVGSVECFSRSRAWILPEPARWPMMARMPARPSATLPRRACVARSAP